ncbi:hypothetical protein FRC02_009702 [Tulasnella sp. 418]|nr:hypothetical protein FRC02_009702 [Tulasnella sp. 418]
MSNRGRRRPPALSITAPSGSSSVIFPSTKVVSADDDDESEETALPSFTVADPESLLEKAAAIKRMTSRANSSASSSANRDSLLSPKSKDKSRTLDAIGSFGKRVVKEVLGGRGNNASSSSQTLAKAYGRGGAGRSLSTHKPVSKSQRTRNDSSPAGPSIPTFTRSSVIFPPSPLRSSNSLPSDSLEQQQSHFTSALPSPAPSIRNPSLHSSLFLPDERLISPITSPVLPPTPSSADGCGPHNGDLTPGQLSIQRPNIKPKRSTGSATPTPTAITARVPSSTEVPPPLPTTIPSKPISVPVISLDAQDNSSVPHPDSRMEMWVHDQRRRRRIRKRRLGTANSNTSASTNGFGNGRSTSLSMQSRDTEEDESDGDDSDMAEAGSDYNEDGGVMRREMMKQLDIEGEEIEKRRKELEARVGEELGILAIDGEDARSRLQVDDEDPDAGGESPAVKVESLLRQPSIAVSSSVSVRQWKRYFEQYSKDHPVPAIPNNWRTSTGSILLPSPAQAKRRNRNSMTSVKTPVSGGGPPYSGARSRRSSVALGPGIGAQAKEMGLGLNFEGQDSNNSNTARWCPCNDPTCAINLEASGSSKRRTPVSPRRPRGSSFNGGMERTLPTMGAPPPPQPTVPQSSGISPSASASGSPLPAGTATATSILLPQLLSLMTNAVTAGSTVTAGTSAEGQPMVPLSAALNLVAALLPLAAQVQVPPLTEQQQSQMGNGMMFPSGSSSAPMTTYPQSSVAPLPVDPSGYYYPYTQSPSAVGTLSIPSQYPSSPHDLRTPSEIESVNPHAFHPQDLSAGEHDIPFSPYSTHVSGARSAFSTMTAPNGLRSAFSSSSSSASSGMDMHSWVNEPSPVSRGELPLIPELPILPPVDSGLGVEGLGIIMSEFNYNRSSELVARTETRTVTSKHIHPATLSRDVEVEDSSTSGSVRSSNDQQGGVPKRRLAMVVPPRGPRPRAADRRSTTNTSSGSYSIGSTDGRRGTLS